MGLTMDGDPLGGAQEPPAPSAPTPALGAPVWRPPRNYSMRQALHSWAFWNLTVGTACVPDPETGVMVHVIPIMVSKGVSEQTAAFMFGLQLLVTVPMYLMLGWAATAFPNRPCSVGSLPARSPSRCWPRLPRHRPAAGVRVPCSPFATPAHRPTGRCREYFGRKAFSQLRAGFS